MIYVGPTDLGRQNNCCIFNCSLLFVEDSVEATNNIG